MKVLMQILVSACAIAATEMVGGSTRPIFWALATMAAMGAIGHLLSGGTSRIAGVLGLFGGLVTAVSLVASGEPAFWARVVAAVSAVAGTGCMARPRSRGRLVEIVTPRRGRVWSQFALFGSVLGCAVLLALGILPRGAKGTLGVTKPIADGIGPMLESLTKGWMEWVDEIWPYKEDGAEAMDEADVVSAFDEGHDLPARADLSPVNTFKLAIRIPDADDFKEVRRKRVYVRSRTYDRFDGWRWTSAEDAQVFFSDESDGIADGWSEVARVPEGNLIEHEVFLAGSMGTELPALVEVEAYRMDNVVSSAPGWFRGGIAGNVRYVARSGASGDVVSGRVIDETSFLGVSSGIELSELRQMAKAIAPSGLSSGETLKRISEFLRERCVYSLRFENPKALSPLKNFLSGERKGYCDHFASAAVMMARSRGIPARMAVGYSGGMADPTRGMIAFLSSDAHAWAEVFIGGRWQVFDTTPEGEGAAREAGEQPLPEFGEEGFQDASAREEGATNSEEDAKIGDSEGSGLSLPPWARFGLVGGGILIGLIAVAFILGPKLVQLVERQLALNAKRKRETIACEEEAPAGYLREFHRLMDNYDVFRPSGATVRELIQLVAKAGLTAPVFAEMQQYHYAARYSGTGRNRSTERRLKREMGLLRRGRSR